MIQTDLYHDIICRLQWFVSYDTEYLHYVYIDINVRKITACINFIFRNN